MNTFNPTSACPKCWSTEAGVKHVVTYIESTGGGYTRVERMRRTCPRCGAKWDELPLDAVKEVTA